MQKEIREREILRLDLQNIQKHNVQIRVLLTEYVNYAHRHTSVRNKESRRQVPENSHCLRLTFTPILINSNQTKNYCPVKPYILPFSSKSKSTNYLRYLLLTHFHHTHLLTKFLSHQTSLLPNFKTSLH